MWPGLTVSMRGIFPGALFAAAFLATNAGDDRRLEQVLAVAISKPAMARAAISGFGWMQWPTAAPVLSALARNQDPSIQAIAIGAFAAHRQDPGGVLVQALASRYPSLQMRAAKAVGALGTREYGSLLRGALGDPDEDVAFHAASALTRLGLSGRDTVGILKRVAEQGGKYARTSAEMVARSEPVGDVATWALAIMRNPKSCRAGIAALGALGDTAQIPQLLELMDHPKWARAAGEAFSMITGADLAKLNLEAEAPPVSVGPTDDPADEDVSLDLDENLPWPSTVSVRTYWSTRLELFQPGRRYLAGLPTDAAGLRQVLVEGRQRQRAAAAVELGIRHPEQRLFDVRARARTQAAILSAWTL